MTMQNPGFVTLSGHRIKVQRWQHDAGVMTFTTVIRGEHLGNDVVAVTKLPSVTLELDEGNSFTGVARLLDRRTTGAGPTAVVRMEIQFTVDAHSNTNLELSTDEKLDAILAEVRALRREIATLRAGSSIPASGGLTPPRPGTTMLDFEIPIEDGSPD